MVSAQFINPLEYRRKAIPLNNYNSVDGLCDAINFTLDNMRTFAGERVNFNFQYDHIRHRIGLKPLFNVDHPNINFMQLSPQLQYMLGFKNGELELTTGKIKTIFKGGKEAVNETIELNQIVWSTRSDDEDIQMLQELSQRVYGMKDSEGKQTECSLRYFPAKAEVVLESEHSHIVSINISNKIQHRLGLTDNIIYLNLRYKVKERD